MVKYLRISVSYLMNFFLQKCGEYFEGELNGSDDNGELYKGIVYFMIVVWTNPSRVIKSSPEITINATWLRDELFECLVTQIKLQQNTFYFTF